MGKRMRVSAILVLAAAGATLAAACTSGHAPPPTERAYGA